MVNISDRWNRDKTSDLQFAFFNGVGWESWENIWGIWNGITPRDAEATRRVATMERGLAPFLVSKDWEPMAPMLQYGVYASRWPMGDQTLWTIVNRNEYDVQGDQMDALTSGDLHYYDVYHGVELKPEARGDKQVLRFTLEAKGYGAILASKTPADSSLQALMAKMKQLTGTSLEGYSHEWKFLPQRIVPIVPTKASNNVPEGMIKIPEGDFSFDVQGIEVEGLNDTDVDVQYPWEDSPRRFHSHRMHIPSFYIDKYPVTNAEYKKFLDSTHYHPKNDLNFLRDWKDGTFPAGAENQPVPWVAMEDARAYATWAGKRLPHEWEWQYAAQGPDARVYPWGNEWNADAVPVPDKSRRMRAPDAVDAHAKGASPFGVMDMVGNVWQWTEEFVDDHTRAAIVRGGNYYQPQGAIWYFPEAYKLGEHGKFLLMAPSMDRSGTIGFRCVVDAVANSPR